MQVELLLADRNLDLIEEGLDVAVRIGQLADSGLVARRVGEVRRCTGRQPALPGGARKAGRAGGSHWPRGDLHRRPSWPRGLAVPLRRAERSRRLAPRLMVNDVEATLVAARAGLGIASALSYQVAEDLAAGRLVRLLAAFEAPPMPVQLVVPSARLRPPRVRAFLDHAARQLAALAVVQALR